jgi:hypothetical protein
MPIKRKKEKGEGGAIKQMPNLTLLNSTFLKKVNRQKN